MKCCSPNLFILISILYTVKDMDTKKLISASLGEIDADIILRGGKIVNVYTREILESDIVIADDKIVHVGNQSKDFVGKNTVIKEIKGKFVCPGLIDSHIHIESSMLTLTEFTKTVVPHGTTTAVIDPHELVNIMGSSGLDLLISEASLLPIRYLIEAPSCVPSLPGFETSGAIIDSNEIGKLMQKKEIFGLGEMMNYPGLLLRLDEVIRKVDSAKKMDKVIEGHAPLLKNKELQAYIAAGIFSDHEATTAEEVVEKLRLGMRIQIREGSFAKDLERIFSTLKDYSIDTRNILIASDDRNPSDLYEKGHLDYTYRLLIKSGVNPLEAIQMLTINPALHLKLQDEIGGIAPGKSADVIVVDNLENFNVLTTIAKGRIIYDNGELAESYREITYPADISNTLLNLEVPSKEELILRSSVQERTHVRVIGITEHSLITEKLEAALSVENGSIIPDIDEDILPVVVINRHTTEKKIGRGFVSGFGIKNAAIASTVVHDCHQLICVGTDYDLIIDAIKILKDSNGGQVIVTPDLITLLPLEFAGIMSFSPIREVVTQQQTLHKALNLIKPKIKDPFMALSFIALPVIPHLKITDHGLVDVDELKIVDVEIAQK